jgi:hypothetical protein
MRWRTRTAVLAVAVSGGALVVAVAPTAGAPAPSPASIVRNAIAAWKHVRSVHVVGTVDTTTENLGLNVRASNGTTGSGTITINGDTVKLVRRGALVYFDADAGFLAKNVSAQAASFAGRWVSTSATGANGKGFAQLIGTAGLLGQIASGSKVSQSTFTKGPNTTVGGVRVLTIVGTNTKTGSHGTIYVARTGPPYIAELHTTSSTGEGQLTFSAYNRPVPVPVSAPRHVITLAQLEQEAAAQAG